LITSIGHRTDPGFLAVSLQIPNHKPCDRLLLLFTKLVSQPKRSPSWPFLHMLKRNQMFYKKMYICQISVKWRMLLI